VEVAEEGKRPCGVVTRRAFYTGGVYVYGSSKSRKRGEAPK